MSGKIELAENQMRGKNRTHGKFKCLENRTRGNQNWQDFEHVEKLDLILTYMLLAS